jgi:Zn-dependent membrane protease YugP
MYYTLFVFVPLLICSFVAQQYVDYVFFKWGQVFNSARLNGVQVAERISQDARLGVRLKIIRQKLGDHYNPRTHEVCLSTQVAEQPSVAALAIAAHELGHAQQKQENASMMRVREVLVPAVRLAPIAGYVLFALGLGLGRLSLIWFGVAVFALTTVFMLLTLPIEFDASRRALVLLERSDLLTAEDRRGARQMLNAAAMTYVVASVFSVVQLGRFILRR